MPLFVFEPRYRKLLADALKANRLISVAMQKSDRVREVPCPVAGLGLIRVSVDHADGTSHLVLQGLTRVELGKPLQSRPYRVYPIRPLHALPVESLLVDALVGKVLELVEQRIQQGGFGLPFPSSVFKKGQAKVNLGHGKTATLTAKEIMQYLKRLPHPGQVADLVTCALLPKARQRQKILETVEIEPRLKRLVQFLLAEIQSPSKTTEP